MGGKCFGVGIKTVTVTNKCLVFDEEARGTASGNCVEGAVRCLVVLRGCRVVPFRVVAAGRTGERVVIVLSLFPFSCCCCVNKRFEQDKKKKQKTLCDQEWRVFGLGQRPK